MNIALFIRTSLDRSSGVSRTRRSRQDATVPAGIQPPQAGIAGWHIR